MLAGAIAAVSAAILAYEVLLTRLLAIVQWHHFATMVISIALLGFGVSGSFLTLARRWILPHFAAAFAVNAALFGLTTPLSFALAQRLPFNALEVIWDPRQLLYLLAFYLLFTVPFVFGANCIALAFMRYGEGIGRIYRSNLLGSGAGALGVLLALYVLTPSDCLRAIAALAFVGAALVCLEVRETRRSRAAAALLLAAVALPLALPSSWIALRISEFKALSTALDLPGAEVLFQDSSPLGLVTVVRSPQVPFRHAPGLSLNAPAIPPDQLGIFVDGEGPGAINAFDGSAESLRYLDFMTSALPYHLLQRPRVLVLGAGGGAAVLQALAQGAPRVDAVELDPVVLGLVRARFADFAGGLYSRPEVEVRAAEARGFVAGSAERWDLIQIPLLGGSGGGAAGARGLAATHLYTEEALRAYLANLAPGGLLAITGWLQLPPRASLRLFATAVRALQGIGVAEPARRLALIRGWDTATLLVKRGEFGPDELAAARAFAVARSFDIAHFPGLDPEEVNRWNVLEAPYFHEAATALAGPEGPAFIAGYKFDIRPSRDDRPHFFDFFSWRSVPELLRLRAGGGGALLEWGYPILFATLLQALALSLLLILLPLRFAPLEPAPARDFRRVAGYFAALGLGFLFVEIAFIERFIVFLAHPLYAVAVVLTGFLVFAGLGAGAAPRLSDWLDETGAGRGVSALELAVAGIIATALVYLIALPPIFAWLMPASDPVRILVALLLIAPLAFWMGMPFPLGLTRVTEAWPSLVPWAWGVNGCASVVSAVLATILAIHWGFTAVILLALALYAAAAAVLRAPLGGQG